ncbi:MAG: 1-deoxy-D-xylulose-5-phosphate reductoisomerase [Acidimicrobiales bacterium]
MAPIRVAVAGSTGSIGTQTLDVIRSERDRYDVVAIGANRSVDLLVAQAEEFHPAVVAIRDATLASELASRVPRGIEVLSGPDALSDLCDPAEIVINGVVGFAGLGVTLRTVRSGKRLGLANKESLIAAGPVVRAEAHPDAEIVPVDSEHCAIHQCLRAGEIDGGRGPVSRLMLTASGGPFRGWTSLQLESVTREQALTHPTWSMGPKITVDSSTLMNKGLEVIEAQELFGVSADDIDVVVHPQSIVHSMVEFRDGAVIAQLSLPDMRLPIGYALAYPDRITTPFGRIDWTELSRLDFEAPDLRNFRCLGLAYEAARVGGTAPAWLNAANEVVVQAFLDGRITWLQIGEILNEVLQTHDGTKASSAEVVIDLDARARRKTVSLLDRTT